MAAAKLLVMNGLGLDDWLEKTIDQRRRRAARRWSSSASTCPASTSCPARTRAPRTRTCGWTSGTASCTWTGSPRRSRRVDPAHAAQYDSQAAAYKARLDALDASVRVANRYHPRGQPQARHLPRRVPLLRSRVRDHDRRRRGPGPRPGPERRIHGPAHHGHPRRRREGDLQRSPVPDQARRPARRRDRGHRRLEPVRRFAGRRPDHELRGRHRLGHRPARGGPASERPVGGLGREPARVTTATITMPAVMAGAPVDRPARRDRGLRRRARRSRTSTSTSPRVAARRIRAERRRQDDAAQVDRRASSGRGPGPSRRSACGPAKPRVGSPTCRRRSSSTGPSRSRSGTWR